MLQLESASSLFFVFAHKNVNRFHVGFFWFHRYSRSKENREAKAVKQSEQYSKCSILLNEQTVLKVDHGKVQLAILPVRRKTWKKTLNDHFQKCEEDKKAAIYLS